MKILILLCVLLPLCQQNAAQVPADVIPHSEENQSRLVRRMINNVFTFIISMDNKIQGLDENIHKNITAVQSIYGAEASAKFKLRYSLKRDKLAAERVPRSKCITELDDSFIMDNETQSTLEYTIQDAMGDWRTEHQKWDDRFRNVVKDFFGYEKEAFQCGLPSLGNDNEDTSDCMNKIYHEVWQIMKNITDECWDEFNKLSEVKERCLTYFALLVQRDVATLAGDIYDTNASFWSMCPDLD